jgi:DNA repair exonuclease SbcCD ATPase subunit
MLLRDEQRDEQQRLRDEQQRLRDQKWDEQVDRLARALNELSEQVQALAGVLSIDVTSSDFRQPKNPDNQGEQNDVPAILGPSRYEQ